MKIGFIGELRFPVLPFGPGGLGRTTHMLATGLLKRGHEVTLHALKSSVFDGEVRQGMPDPKDYDVIFDFSHEHAVSRVHPKAPVLNLIGDKECQYLPPQAAVESYHMAAVYPGARVIPAGMDVDNIPFGERGKGEYLIFMGLIHPYKGYEDALRIGQITGLPVKFVGPRAVDVPLPDYIGPVYDDAVKFKLLADARALLCPYYNDAAPRVPLEAAACGTPTLCYKVDGTSEHVAHGVTGFYCANSWDMAANVRRVRELDREQMRAWVVENHSLEKTLDRHEALLQTILDGERW